MFTAHVQNVLELAGWSPGRRVTPDRWVKPLIAEGFVMLPTAVAVLEQFGGLELVPRRELGDKFAPASIRFDPLLAAQGEFDRIDYWQCELNTRLSPIAEVGFAMLLLASDDRG